eukprot:TRINITY_DN23468_c0_g1_i1.p1 TRINITY_DN23468_c0_g1~~TRINITY_DN23468_c0_g1_i1.p1  ORF type:complete len:209 (-),score=42.16 TRINITY_DN23468_c0_g1_i1:44-619(-)
MHQVGKTSLVQRYLHGNFSTHVTATVGAAFGSKRIEMNGVPIILRIWDTAGSERYESMTRMYYKGARAAIVCYDICNRKSFDKLCFWITELRESEPGCAIFIAGTKVDLAVQTPDLREVSAADIAQYATEKDISTAHLFETSAKDNIGIMEIFEEITKETYEKEKSVTVVPNADNLANIQTPTTNGKGCCN